MEIQKDKNGIIFVNGSVTSDNAEAYREELLTYAQGRELSDIKQYVRKQLADHRR